MVSEEIVNIKFPFSIDAAWQRPALLVFISSICVFIFNLHIKQDMKNLKRFYPEMLHDFPLYISLFI